MNKKSFSGAAVIALLVVTTGTPAWADVTVKAEAGAVANTEINSTSDTGVGGQVGASIEFATKPGANED